MAAVLTVHFMGYGMTACMREGPPSAWPEGHKWCSEWDKVTCEDCLLGRDLIHTYTIAADGKSITCLRCKRTSHSLKDVEHKFCGSCNVFHDNIWPPSRHWWINSLKQMNPDIEALKRFKARMIAIARANGDSFETTVTFDEKGYHIRVIERADKHCFLTGDGETVTAAFDDAYASLVDALKEWGYKDSV